MTSQLQFRALDESGVYFGIGGTGEQGTADYQKRMAIHLVGEDNTRWSAFLDGDAMTRFIALLRRGADAPPRIELARMDNSFTAQWIVGGDGGDRLRCTHSFHDREVRSWDPLEFEEIEERRILEFSAEIANDMAEYINWLSGSDENVPGFWRRNAIAIEICDLEIKEEPALKRLDALKPHDAIRIIGNVARRGRIDLAVLLLERLHRLGRIDSDQVKDLPTLYEHEDPVDVSWGDLILWSGLTRPRKEEPAPRAYDDPGYSASDYCECFEDAFGEELERIDFAKINFRDEQARLRRLAENLDRHFSNVNYPKAAPGELIPNIATAQIQMKADEGRTGWGNILNYTPALSYDEVRRLLLFSHRVCYEDPLTQIVGPIARWINDRPYEIALRPQSARDLIFGRRVRMQPGEVGEAHFSLLRDTLTNTQRLATLIRAKIVIPHELKEVGASEYDWQAREYPRFPNRPVRFAIEGDAILLGRLMGRDCLKNFGIPKEILANAHSFLGECGSLDESEDDLDTHDWISNFYWGRDGLDEIYPPFSNWLDHLYRLNMYDRYNRAKGLGYSQHFTHSDGYKLLAIINAARKLQDMDLGSAYAHRLREDDIRLERLSAQLRPKMDVLKDEDLIKIRQDDELFASWRSTISDSLQAVESFDAAVGQANGTLLREEIHDRMRRWYDERSKRLKSDFLKGAFDVAEGAIVSVVTGLALSEATSVPSLAVGAAYTTVKSAARIFAWRHRGELMRRHFLAVI